MDKFKDQFLNPITILILLLLLIAALIILKYCQIIFIDDQFLNQLITLSGMVSGLLLIVWQIGKQHTNTIKLQEDALRQKIKLNVFSELDTPLNKCQDSLSNIGASIQTLPIKFSLRTYQAKLVPNFQPTPIEERAETLTKMHFGAIQDLISLVKVLEKYEIIFPENAIKLTIERISKDIENIGKSFNAFLDSARKFLPIDVPEEQVKDLGKIYVPPLPSDEQLEMLRGLTMNYIKNAANLQGYIYDIRRESQNLFLGSLFQRKLPDRKPTDTTIEVIKFSDTNE